MRYSLKNLPPDLKAVPAWFVTALISYVDTGDLGDEPVFRSFLEDSLSGVLRGADAVTLENLQPIFWLIVNYTPAGCWGSPVRVAAWQERFRVAR